MEFVPLFGEFLIVVGRKPKRLSCLFVIEVLVPMGGLSNYFKIYRSREVAKIYGSLLKIGTGQLGVAKIGSHQIGAAEIRSSQVRTAKIRLLQVGAKCTESQISAGQMRACHISLRKVNLS